MKKIEAIIQRAREEDVVSALQELRLGGFTIYDGKGAGRTTKSEYGDPFTNILTVLTVVEDSQVDKIVSTIVDAAQMGTTGDGKVFVSSVDEVTDISTGKKGEGIL